VERSLSLLTVVFDLGGVLVPPEGSIGDLAAELDVGRVELAAAYWRARDEYDRGGSSTEFWTQVTDEVDRPVGAGGVARLDAVDAARWSIPGPGVESMLADVTRTRTRLAVLSNAPASLAATVRSAPWSSAFSTLMFSSDVGVMKPEPAIYALADDRIGAADDGVLFFDDRRANVEAARRHGWRAHLWTDLADARRVLLAAGAIGE
jgi:putative hydrolase of the HAD superfamily